MGRTIRIGHTAITWPNEEIEQAAEDLAACGYWGTETFGWVLEDWARRGADLRHVFEKNGVALASMYVNLEVADPVKREDSLHQVMKWVERFKPFQGSVVVIGSAMVDRRSFRFREHRTHIVETLNEAARRIADQGLAACFHPHTGTAVENEEEIRQVMDEVDSRYVHFAPDLGQIAKGGSDPAAIVRDYYSLIRMVHLKDYASGAVKYESTGEEIDETGFLGYTPLGEGTVDIAGILRYLEDRHYDGCAMVELDGNHFSPTRKGRAPMSPLEAIRISRAYLAGLGYEFAGRGDADVGDSHRGR